MRPDFPRIYDAIRATLEYYGIGRIRDVMFRLQGLSNYGYIDGYEGLAYTLYERMEEEIIQHNIGSLPAIQNYLYENVLKAWLEDWRIASLHKDYFLYQIEKYNDRAYQEFVEDDKKKNEAFIKTLDPSKTSGKSYEIEYKPVWGLMLGSMSLSKKTEIYKGFRSTENAPDYIDLTYVDEYFQKIDKLLSTFRNIVEKYVRQYDEGKIVPLGNMGQLPSSTKNENKLLEESIPIPSYKVKTNLSVAKLAYLFRMLYDAGLLASANKEDLYRSLSANFTTKKTDNISTNTLNNDFNSPEKATAEFWEAKLKEMLKQAKSI